MKIRTVLAVFQQIRRGGLYIILYGGETFLERIMIIGGCGCGKTTLSKKLSDKLNLPLIHLDRLYWRDYWKAVPDHEFDRQLLQELTNPRWIIDGNITRTIPLRLEYCDTVIYMDYSRIRCVYGVISRVIKNYGKSRPDMGGYCPERFDYAFLKSVWNFNKRNRAGYYEMLSSKKGLKLIIIKNRRQAVKFSNSL